MAEANSVARPPNLVLILTDNQGAWTLGCYGNPDIRTPNIDRLRATGCCSRTATVPTPSVRRRGRPADRPHAVAARCARYLTAGEAQVGPKAYSTIAEFRTLPKILSEAGYTCGLSGKWHLGNNLKPQEGFTSWVTMPHGDTRTFYKADVIEDGKVRKEPGYLTDFWTDHGVRFIKENKDRPFFLFLAYNGPYGFGPGHAPPGPQPPRRLLRRQGVEVVPAPEDESLAQ